MQMSTCPNQSGTQIQKGGGGQTLFEIVQKNNFLWKREASQTAVAQARDVVGLQCVYSQYAISFHTDWSYSTLGGSDNL